MLGSGTVAGASRLQEGLRPGPRVPVPSRRAVRTSAAGWGPRGVTRLVAHPLTAPRTALRAGRRAPSIAPHELKPVATATKRAADAQEPAGTDDEGVSSSGSDNLADVAPSPDADACAAPAAACAQAPAGPLPPAPGPLMLLVVEAFAGSYPVARAAPALADAGVARVVAYAGIELDFAQCAPSHEEMGIDAAEAYLNLGAGEVPGDVTSAAARSAVVDFVRQRLQAGGGADGGDADGGGSGALDAVAVYGGPPCQRYSAAAADPIRFPLRYKLRDAERALHEALKANAAAAAALHDANRQPAAKSKRAAKVWEAQRIAAGEAAAAAREHLAAAQEELSQWETAAREEAAKDAAGLQDSDRLVRSFLHLYKAVEAEAHARGVPCFVVMENPYSSRDRGLWNRPFMKITHLLELPRTSAGDKEHYSSKFRPSEGAWLRTTYINYCCFSADAPPKPTILFTNLPAGALRDRRCRSNRPGRAGGPDCKVPAASKHVTVKLTEGAHQRAIWPQEFVAETVRSVVNSAPGERERLAAAAAAGGSDAGGGGGEVERWPLEALVSALEPCAAPDAAKQIAAMHELRARLVRSSRSQREALALEAMEAGAGTLVPSLVAMLVEHAGSDRGLAALGLLDALAAMRRRNALITSEGLLEALAAIVADDEPGTGPATPAAVLLLATLSTSDITLHKVGRETRQRIRASPGLADAMASHVLWGTPLLDAAVQLLARLCLESGALHPVGETVQQRHPHLSATLEAAMPALKQRAGNAARRLLKALQP